MVYWKPMRPPVPQECPHEKRMAARRLIRTREDATPTDSDGPFEANVTCLADIAAESVSLWGSVIPLGKVTTLTGAAGVGKSLLTLNIAASITRGNIIASTHQGDTATSGDDATTTVTRGPGTANNRDERDPANVMLISSEDDLKDVVGPRLKQAGADLSRVHALRGVSRRDVEPDDQTCWRVKRDIAANRRCPYVGVVIARKEYWTIAGAAVVER